MIEQTFAFTDIPKVATLAFLELLLSADNAVVLGLLCLGLPQHLRKKALFVGLISAFVFRALVILLVTYLLAFTWLQAVGGAYLIFLSIRHFTQKNKVIERKPATFWKTVVLIELYDLLFAIDSILAGVAFINSSFSKLWIVYTGGMIGLIAMRFAAKTFSSLIDHFPRLEVSAYLMVGWIGIKLGLGAIPWHLPYPIFWGVIALLFLLGFFPRKR